MSENIKFTVSKHERLTIHNIYSNAMKVTDKKMAQKYMNDFVKWSMKHEKIDKSDAIKMFKSNFRYYGPFYNKYRMTKMTDFYDL